MDRKGQTWCADALDVVFTVLSTSKPVPGRDYYVHEVVYLEHGQAPHLVGSKAELEEALDLPFARVFTQVA